MKEVFKDIPGYEGLYQVSENGKVLALEREVKNKHNKTHIRKGHLKAIRESKKGYLRTSLTDSNGILKTVSIHRLVALTFLKKETDSRNQINHIDGNKENNHFSNLEWCTAQENLKHALDTGLRSNKLKPEFKGYNHKKSKLTKENVDYIKTSDLSLRKLASMFGVHHSIIWGIRNNKRYVMK